MATERHAVFQVTNGKVWSEMVRRLQNHPGLETICLPATREQDW
jgi:hypothetical protein